MNELITRALTLTAGRPPLSTSSNEVHALQLDGHACVLKTPQYRRNPLREYGLSILQCVVLTHTGTRRLRLK